MIKPYDWLWQMANARLGRTKDLDQSATRTALVTAATDVLREDGFVGATARAIAARAEVNSAAVFYHFGSVHELLLAALDATSGERLARYREATVGVTDIAKLVEVFLALNREDHDAGHVAVMAAMVGGASAIPGLGGAIEQRVAPWIDLASTVIGDCARANGLESLVDARIAARLIVALFLGSELLTQLGVEDDTSADLVAEFQRLLKITAPFLQLLGATG